MGYLADKRAEIKQLFGRPKLTIALVPKTCWCSNVRDHATKQQWDVLRKATYRTAGHVCEICGGKGPKWPVECHEKWQYRIRKGVKTQILRGLIALCPSCHAVKHMGRSIVVGEGDNAMVHLAAVNDWTEEQVEHYLNLVFDIWERRSRYEWNLDLSWLKDNYGLDLQPKR